MKRMDEKETHPLSAPEDMREQHAKMAMRSKPQMDVNKLKAALLAKMQGQK